MKSLRLILTALFGALLCNPMASQADDIDIYSGLAGVAGLPNVLFVIDNAANFSSSASGTSCLINGVATAMSGTVGGIEQCALYNVISALPTNSDGTARVNVGVMLYNATNIQDVNNANCGGSSGGCLAQPLIPMDASHKTGFLNWIKAWTTTGGGGAGYVKASGEATAAAMEEAWAYYAGQTGVSGRDYDSIQPPAGCQRNFVIFIGNSYSSAGTPGDALNTASTTLNAAPNVTTAQKTLILSTISTNYTSTLGFACGTGSFTFPSSGHETKGYYGDEWSRYMYQTDIYNSTSGTENIITYTVGLLGASCQAEYAATLSSMAKNGGGKYFPTADYNGLVSAILKILNEIQAVNSVFASASLPVSVNAQGTFLNQIYMGMFRPDANGLPRWVGNLKQYQFGYDQSTQTLSLVDSLGQPALSSAGTGFISPNAVSFWTTKDTTVEPDLNGGFWRNMPNGVGGGYDYPDGELVEKGGAAQVIRRTNLWDDYAGQPTSPRNVYTYCPSGTACNAALSDSSNAFATNNSGITAASFGASNISVHSIERCVAVSTNCPVVDGTKAVVTTNTPHGYNSGDAVTITGANPTVYNVTQNVTVTGPSTFTITGLPDWPTTPTVGTYTAMLHGATQISVQSITRSSSATTSGSFSSGCTPNLNCETVTVTTAVAHGLNPGDSANITGAIPTDYNGVVTVVTTPTSTTFTYSIPVYPTAPAANSYVAVVHPYNVSISSIAKVTGNWTVTTVNAHGFHVGETVTISGVTGSNLNGSWTIASVPTPTTFTLSVVGSVTGGTGGTASPSTTPVSISTLTRTGTTGTATAKATGLPSGYFANGDYVDITTTGTAPNEQGYAVSAMITCTPVSTTNASCAGSSFTYPITVTPAVSASGTIQVSAPGPQVSIAAGQITRSGTTATVTGVTNAFFDQATVDIQATGTAYAAEQNYTGTWTITCPVSCSTAFTFGPVTLAPATPPTGAIAAYSGTAPPNKDYLIKWVRGDDNLCDEASPDTNCPNQTSINIRPSLHGDVLHSRPTVVNYGGTTGVVVFYGSNDGVFRAINGNQTAAIGSHPAGGELWSFIPTEFYGQLTRLHDNSPVLLLSTTPPGIVPTPLKKNYFVDGSTSIYQKLNADGTTNTAYLFLSMRRGGSFIYALDVTDPANPKFLWKRSNVDTDYGELGQTWSQPKAAFVKGYPKPVLIFGAGYDTAEDAEPPTTDTVGRGIFVVDATNGNVVWKATWGATSACGGTTTKAACTVAGMTESIPSDITLADISGPDGYIDRLYAADMGGNIWRVDLEPTTSNLTPDFWQVTQLAALGCNSGACGSGATPRKFFYPADVVPTPAFDAVLIGSGDREHPLYTSQSYSVTNRFYMVKDPNTGNDGSSLTTPYNETNLEDITSTLTYDNNMNGYYVTLGTGEKVVNAPLTVAGYTYFGTNTPAIPSSNSCLSNLGTAKSYKISPLSGATTRTVYDGGGLPPSPVAGLVAIDLGGGKEANVPFCIGCGGPGATSSLSPTLPEIKVPTARVRTYWYRENAD